MRVKESMDLDGDRKRLVMAGLGKTQRDTAKQSQELRRSLVPRDLAWQKRLLPPSNTK